MEMIDEEDAGLMTDTDNVPDLKGMTPHEVCAEATHWSYTYAPHFTATFEEKEEVLITQEQLDSVDPRIAIILKALFADCPEAWVYAEDIQTSLAHASVKPPSYMHGETRMYIHKVLEVHPSDKADTCKVKLDQYTVDTVDGVVYVKYSTISTMVLPLDMLEVMIPQSKGAIKAGLLLGITPEEIADMLYNPGNPDYAEILEAAKEFRGMDMTAGL